MGSVHDRFGVVGHEPTLPGQRLSFAMGAGAKLHVLLYPEGMVKLNQSAGEIMTRCDGRRSIAEIAVELETAFNATGLEGEVTAFVEMAIQQQWLRA